MRRRRAISIAVLLVAAQSCTMAWAADAGAARKRQRTVVTLQTHPALAGVRIVQEGRTWRTDSRGRVRISVRRHRGGRLSPEGFPYATPRVRPRTVRPGVVASFSRFSWHGWPKRVRVGLSLAYRVRLRFADVSGQPIDPGRIERVVIKSYRGSRTIGPGVDTLRLQGSRVGPYGRHGGLASKAVGYSVTEVVIDGSNLVNRGEIRFYPFRTRVVPIELLFFDLDITSRDALFGSRIGSRVDVIGPDGRTRRVALGAGGRVHLERLPRGRYRVRTNATGLGASRLVTLSRHQVVEVRVLSVIDLLLLGAAGSCLAIGLVLVRRPRLRARIAGRVARRLSPRAGPAR